jgi:plastocyanin
VRAVRLSAFLASLAFIVFLALGGGCASPMSTVQGGLEISGGGRSRASIENTVVYLVCDKPEPAAAHPAMATLVADASGLHPQVLAVAAGTRVEVRNKDAVFHKVFSISPAQPFNAGAVSPGGTHSVVFDHPGVIHVFCELHPKESAYIYVVPTQRFTRADARGHFHFAGVAPGACTLHTWHPDNGETSQAVVVPKHGELQVKVTD